MKFWSRLSVVLLLLLGIGHTQAPTPTQFVLGNTDGYMKSLKMQGAFSSGHTYTVPVSVGVTNTISGYQANDVVIVSNVAYYSTTSANTATPPSSPWSVLGSASSGGGSLNYRGAWTASTTYAVGDLVTNGGSLYESPSAFTSGSTFNSSNWNLLAGVGATGPAPTLTMGTVTSLSPGATPTASFSGSGGSYTLNLGIPQGTAGTNGSNGTSPTLAIGTVTSLSAGATPTASFSVSGTTYTLSLGIPAGSNGTNGSNGSTPTLAAGTVTALAAGATPTITIGGTPPELHHQSGHPLWRNWREWCIDRAAHRLQRLYHLRTVCPGDLRQQCLAVAAGLQRWQHSWHGSDVLACVRRCIRLCCGGCRFAHSYRA